jgi:hypothetical protein
MNRDFFHTGLQVSRSDLQALLNGGRPGDPYYVDYRNGDDLNDGKSWDRAWKTYGRAFNTNHEFHVTSNNNDFVFVDGDSTVTETAMVSITVNRVHTFGCNGPLPIYGRGAGAKISIGVTTDTDDIALIQNTGVRNTFTGIKFMSSNTLTQAAYAFAEGGEYTRFNNCEFYKSDKLTTAAVAELLLNGDTAEFVHCCFGDLVNAKGGSSAPRPNVLVNRETITGKVARDCVFYECMFNQKALHADANFIYGSGATDIERSLTIVRSIFNNAILASATIADAITFGGAQTQGNVLVIDPAMLNVTALAEANQNVFVTGAVPTAATTGVAVEIAA